MTERPVLEVSESTDVFLLEQLIYKKIRQDIGACSGKKFAHLCAKPPTDFSSIVSKGRHFIDILII